jgi:probable Rubsico expression protein CbbX
MWGIRLKSFNTATLLFVVVALAVMWFTLPHIAAAIIFGIMLLVVPVILSMRDGMRQTNSANLVARGITPESMRYINSIDANMRREMTGMVPTAVIRRFTRHPAVIIGSPAEGRGGTASPALASWATAGSRPGPAASSAPFTSAQPRTRSGPASGRPGPKGGRRGKTPEVLGPDATVTLAEERRAAGIDDLFQKLDKELVGLVPVKKKVEEIGSLLLVDRVRQRFGLSAARPNLHMCFTGAPGTGKTTVAMMMADLLHRLGYLEKGHLVHAMRDDLVGEYIGHTAPKTKAVLERAMGGVLFIDEAYSLYRADDSKDYGQECIDILLQVMENDRDKLVVILAGYKDRMDRFFESNPGMSSRIAHHLHFAEYEADELLAIGQMMLERSSYYMSDTATAAFRDYLSAVMDEPRFANARSVRNELERARLRHAYRLAADPDHVRTMDDLMRLEAADITVNAAGGL